MIPIQKITLHKLRMRMKIHFKRVLAHSKIKNFLS